MGELESNLQRRCQKILKDAGAFAFKTHGDMYSRVGIPDLVACIPSNEDVIRKLLDEGWFKNNKVGIFVGFELKRAGKLCEVSNAQKIVGKEIKEAGGIWFALDNSDDVRVIVKHIKGEL